MVRWSSFAALESASYCVTRLDCLAKKCIVYPCHDFQHSVFEETWNNLKQKQVHVTKQKMLCRHDLFVLAKDSPSAVHTSGSWKLRKLRDPQRSARGLQGAKTFFDGAHQAIHQPIPRKYWKCRGMTWISSMLMKWQLLHPQNIEKIRTGVTKSPRPDV